MLFITWDSYYCPAWQGTMTMHIKELPAELNSQKFLEIGITLLRIVTYQFWIYIDFLFPVLKMKAYTSNICLVNRLMIWKKKVSQGTWVKWFVPRLNSRSTVQQKMDHRKYLSVCNHASILSTKTYWHVCILAILWMPVFRCWRTLTIATFF